MTEHPKPHRPVQVQHLKAQLKPMLPEMGPDPIADPPSAASVWNIANALTILRLLLVPVFLVALFWGSGHQTGARIVATFDAILAAFFQNVLR